MPVTRHLLSILLQTCSNMFKCAALFFCLLNFVIHTKSDGSLESILANRKLQFIFFSGKGGVGKTTVSSSFAIELASRTPGKVLLISTDPAHSLSDAFLINFNSKPTSVPGVSNLFVMEINPQDQLEKEIKSWEAIAKDIGFDMATELQKLQKWIVSIPGIDEATAMSTILGYIKNENFEVVVFDTAPTGHTLKLLQLPEVLQLGLAQLESWQAKLWGYYESFKGLLQMSDPDAGKNSGRSKKRLEKKFKDYKKSIDEVAAMIKDQTRTTFVAVCIAEYLSISETSRLLSQLAVQKISYSHVVVNQLIKESPTTKELQIIEEFLSQEHANVSTRVLEKLKHATVAAFARSNIQKKYLNMLVEAPEAKNVEIIEIPLFNSEVTGVEALRKFSKYLSKAAMNEEELSKNEL